MSGWWNGTLGDGHGRGGRWRRVRRGLMVAVLVVAGACGGDDSSESAEADTDDAASSITEAGGDGSGDSSDDPADEGDDGDEDADGDGDGSSGDPGGAGGDDESGATGSDGSTPATDDDRDDGDQDHGDDEPGDDASDDASEPSTDGAGDGAATSPPTAAQICSAVPAEDVATAIGVGGVTAAPGDGASTPQCSYRFTTASGTESNATVAVLRPDGDLDGRTGRDAYRYTVDLNLRAGGSDVTQTPLDVGDEAVLLEGGQLRFGVIRYGERIVTIIVSTAIIDRRSATALAAATAPLAP